MLRDKLSFLHLSSAYDHCWVEQCSSLQRRQLAIANLRLFSKPLHSGVANFLEERFICQRWAWITRRPLTEQLKEFSIVFLTLFDKRLLLFQTAGTPWPRRFQSCWSIRSPLMKALDRSVKTLGVWILTCWYIH